MNENTQIKLFENKKVRTVWDNVTEEWYFSVVDVIEVLTESPTPRRYWSDLKIKHKKEGSQLYDKSVQLKMKSSKDGKMYLTDTLDTEGILRLIESVPSKKENHLKYGLLKLEVKD